MKSRTLLLIMVILINGCAFMGSIHQDDKSLRLVTEEFDPLLTNIYQYKSKFGEYPKQLNPETSDLFANVSEYTNEFMTMNKEYSGYTFIYKVNKNASEFTITILGIRHLVHIGNMLDYHITLVFHSSGKYAQKPHQHVKKRIGKWALIEEWHA